MATKRLAVRRRTRPDDPEITTRQARLAAYADLRPDAERPARPELQAGNAKTGLNGRFFGAIRVWNLPPMATCPGRSAWCSANCYNADDRPDIYAISDWEANWRAVEGAPEATRDYVLQELAASPGPVGVRIHSSGDFYSAAYMDWWGEILDRAPDVRFWAYTRSWSRPELQAPLAALRRRPNLQLFASWDRTMPPPPAGWRLSLMSEDVDQSDPRNLVCPEQYAGGKSCADCGYCILKRGGNVVFHTH